MVRIIDEYLFEKTSIARYLFAMFIGVLNTDTNRLEINGKALSTMDICAYANITTNEFSRAIKEFYRHNIILTIRARGKEFYYINPRFMREETIDIFKFEWLLELFDEEPNHIDKNLVYFKKGKKNISINIGNSLPK